MPELETLIEAILRGQLKDRYDTLSKVDKMNASQAVLDILIPALPVLEEIKAAAWEEGLKAGDIDGYFAYDNRDKGPPNPYRSETP